MPDRLSVRPPWPTTSYEHVYELPPNDPARTVTRPFDGQLDVTCGQRPQLSSSDAKAEVRSQLLTDVLQNDKVGSPEQLKPKPPQPHEASMVSPGLHE